MNRKLVYTLGLSGFFLMWGVFGFVAGAPRSDSAWQATRPPQESTSMPLETNAQGIPLTGESEPVLTEIFVFYGLIGLTALFLTLALLNFANKWISPNKQSGSQPPHETNEK